MYISKIVMEAYSVMAHLFRIIREEALYEKSSNKRKKFDFRTKPGLCSRLEDKK